MAKRKSFIAAFHQVQHQNDIPPQLADDVMAPFTVLEPRVIKFGEYHYQLLAQRIAPGAYRGEFKRYGQDDLPHAGAPNREEREFEMEPEESTIERNRFLFFQDRKLLVWQENRRASSIQTLSRYLSTATGFVFTLPSLLTSEAHLRLLLGRHKAKAIEVRVARPLNPEMYRGLGDTERVLELIGGLGGMSANLRISANSQGVRGRFLDAARALGLARGLVDSGCAKTARFDLEGIDYPIDLIADRLRTRFEVEMNGRYPNPAQVYAKLENARAEVGDELVAILG